MRRDRAICEPRQGRRGCVVADPSVQHPYTPGVAMSPPSKIRTWYVATVVGLAVVGGCGASRRMSLNAVDTQLRAKGSMLERAPGRGPLRLGDYEVSQITVEPTQVDPQGALASEDVRRPMLQHHLAMTLRAPDDQTWDVQCISQRRQSTSADYAAVAGVNRDDIAVECRVLGAGAQWTFRTEAELGTNFQGRLSGPADASLDVEVLLYVQRWGWLRRHLPDPVAQVRQGDKAVAAMLLGRPEQAWIAPSLTVDLATPSLAAMLALHHLPLGLDG